MLQFQRAGTGPTVVLIHGLLGSHNIFDRVVPLLAPDFDVITLDLPGHGGSDVPPDAHTMADAAREVAETLQSLGATSDSGQAPVIVGHSWGGYVVAEMIASQPQSLRAAALIYSQPYADPADKQQSRTALIRRFETEEWDAIVRDVFPLYFADYDPPELFEEAIAISKQASVEGARFALSTIRDRRDHAATIEQADIPVLFVSGTDDAAMPPIDLRAPHVSHVQTHASHMGPMTIPDELAGILTDWFNGLDAVLSSHE